MAAFFGSTKIVAQDFPRRFPQELLHHAQLVVLLGARDPEDTAPRQLQQMGEVHVSPVKQDDLARAQSGAHGVGVIPVGVPGRVEQHETRQETLQIQPQMTLGRSLAAAVFGPVQTRGDEFDGRRINDVNGAGEAPGPAVARTPIQRRTQTAQVREHPPEQRLGQGGVAFLVGVGETVLARRRGSAHGRERPRVQAQAVTHIVETDGVDELRVE